MVLVFCGTFYTSHRYTHAHVYIEQQLESC